MSRKKKVWKIILIIFGVLILSLAGVGWYLLSRWEGIVATQLESYAQKITKGLYHAEMKSVRIHLINGSLHVSGLSLYPDSSKLEYLKSVDSIPATYGRIYVETVRLNGVNFQRKKSREGRSLLFSEISISSPDVTIIHDSRGVHLPHDTLSLSKDKPSYTSPLYKIISPVFDKIGVEQIRILNGKVAFDMQSDSDTSTYVLEDVSFHAEKFLVDSTRYDEDKILYCDDLHFSVGNARHTMAGKLYGIDVSKIVLAFKDSIFSVENFNLLPQYPKEEFAYRNPRHSDWMRLSAGNVVCKGLDFRSLILDRSLKMDSLLVRDVKFENYKNQKIVIEHHKMKLLYELFQRFKIPVHIPTAKVDNLSVIYEELPKKGTNAGLISFTDIHGEFHGLTNVPDSLTQTSKLVARAKLMNEGQINATIFLPVDSLNDRFEIIGTLGSMKMTTLNRIVEPLAPARIQNGTIKGMDYHIVGGRYKALINMQLLYNDLTAEVFKENDKHERSSSHVISLLANGLIRRDNPETGEGKEPLRVHVEHIRDPYHSSFNYLWKIYFAGLEETVGFTKERQNKLQKAKNTFEKFKNGFKKKKD